jgi:hypothetical protein
MEEMGRPMEANSRTPGLEQCGQSHHAMLDSENLQGVCVQAVEEQVTGKTTEQQSRKANSNSVWLLAPRW